MPKRPVTAEHDGVSTYEGGLCGNQFGLHCPKCGSCEDVVVTASVEVLLCGDGTDNSDNGDTEWGATSAARCSEYGCGWHGQVKQLITIGDANA